jgi:hypothetical protein
MPPAIHTCGVVPYLAGTNLPNAPSISATVPFFKLCKLIVKSPNAFT